MKILLAAAILFSALTALALDCDSECPAQKAAVASVATDCDPECPAAAGPAR